jgi:hypothetical protein
MANGRPDRSEAADYYFMYIDKVPTDDICAYLSAQCEQTMTLLQAVSVDFSLRRYAMNKWSVREVISHVNDAERVFSFRALWFGRGFGTPLPSFDQNVAIGSAAADARSWDSHIQEFRAIRAGTLAFFRNLPNDAWGRRGTASGNTFSVRALAFLIGGHVAHHLNILRDRYLKDVDFI